MTPAAIIQKVAEDGVTLTATPSGSIKACGNGDAVSRWLPIIREHKPKILEALQDAGKAVAPTSASENAAVYQHIHNNPDLGCRSCRTP